MGCLNFMSPFNIYIITLFPEYFSSPLSASLIGKAVKNNIVRIHLINLRDFAINRHGQVDDTPYGGGHGMVLMIEPLKKALDSIDEKTLKILLSPRGYLWEQKKCRATLGKIPGEYDGLTLICGHYEGVDERIVEFVDDSIRIGNYILSGGESAAMVVLDSLVRLLPGFMGNPLSIEEESFEGEQNIEYPQYTKPAEYEGLKVPDVLLSGHHGKIKLWRKEQAGQAVKKFIRDAERPD